MRSGERRIEVTESHRQTKADWITGSSWTKTDVSCHLLFWTSALISFKAWTHSSVGLFSLQYQIVSFEIWLIQRNTENTETDDVSLARQYAWYADIYATLCFSSCSSAPSKQVVCNYQRWVKRNIRCLSLEKVVAARLMSTIWCCKNCSLAYRQDLISTMVHLCPEC